MFLRFLQFMVLILIFLPAIPARALDPLTVDVGKVVFQTGEKVSARVLVSVGQSEGAPISGLRSEDFEIRENGGDVFRPTQVLPLSETEHRLFYFLMMDVQADSPTSLTYIRQASARFILDLGYRYPGLVMTYAGEPRFINQMEDSPKRIEVAVNAVSPSAGPSRLVDGLFHVLKRLDEINRNEPKRFEKPILILFTDGREQGSLFSVEAAKRLILESRISLFLVWYGPFQDTISELSELAKMTGGDVFYVDQPNQLPEKAALIAGRLKNLYLVRYQSTLSNPFNQAYDLEVRVGAAGRIGIGRRGYITAANIKKPDPLNKKTGLIGGMILLLIGLAFGFWFIKRKRPIKAPEN